MIDDPEEFAWQQLEKKQQQQQHKKPTPVTEREALRIAYNALIEIDKQTPYPLAKHAVMVINSVLNAPALQLDAIERAYFHGKQQGIAESEAINKMQEWNTSDMAHRSGGLSVEQAPNDLIRQSEREGWRYAKECEAEIKRLKELAEYRLQLLMKMPEQADQKPVAWMTNSEQDVTAEFLFSHVQTQMHKIPLYEAPPRKEWVLLTDEEIVEILDFDSPTIKKFAYAIEAKLRERNT
jgi:hypothetical protein